MEIKIRIKEWFDGPRDYSEGLNLLKEVSKKGTVLGKLSKGETKTRREKLEYELKHFLGLKVILPPVPSSVKTTLVITSKLGSTPNIEAKLRFSLIPKEKSIDDYPEEVKKLINEWSPLYMNRSKNQKKLIELGEENTPDVIAKRAKLIEKIHEASDRMEVLYEAFKTFETSGKLPENFAPAEKKKAITGSLSIEDLKKEKKNLQASLVKDRNMLEYQSKTKPDDGISKPMPDGPKKITIEKRIKAKEAQIAAIDMEIAQRG